MGHSCRSSLNHSSINRSSYYRFFDAIDDVADIVVGDVGTGGEAHTDFEDGFTDAVDVGGTALIDGLLVHGLPDGTGFYFLVEHEDAEGFDIFVGLAIGGGTVGYMDDTGGSSYCCLDDFFVGVLLTFYSHVRIKGDGAEPVVGVIYRLVGQRGKGCGLFVDMDTRNVGKEFFVEGLYVFVVGDVVVNDGHLTSADAGADVGHAVVVAYLLVLVVGVRLTILGGVHHYFIPFFIGICDEGAAPRGGDHFVTVEREYSIFAEGAKDLAVVARTEAFGGIFYDGDAVFVGNGHYLVAVVGHTVEGDGDDGFWIFAGLGLAVEDGFLKEFGVHIPGMGLGVDENGGGAEIGDGMGGGTEGETLHADFITRAYATGKEGEVDGGCTGAEGDDSLVLTDKGFKVFLEAIDVGAEGYDPVGIEGFFDVLLFFTCLAHAGKAEVDGFSF